MRRRRARVDRHGVVHCRACGGEDLMVRSGETDKKLRRLKCANCDQRQWLRARDVPKLLR